MPLRTAHKLCPQAIFVDGHPDRYREYSQRVRQVLERFTPLVEMASIDEAYLDMTGTERLHGPPLKSADALHRAIGSATSLNCSIGIATSRLVAKVSSDQAKPNGILWVWRWRASRAGRMPADGSMRASASDPIRSRLVTSILTPWIPATKRFWTPR
jgi:DNA polymerase-4